MFGQMNATPITDRLNSPPISESLEQAVARLLDVTEHPAITKWVQFPKALFLFLTVPGDPESGAFYVYDRRSRGWFWVDFEDEKFGGYNSSDYERLVRECRFLDIVENPQLLRSKARWIIQAGSRPRIGTQFSQVASTPRTAD
jgi:hypothetical protein